MPLKKKKICINLIFLCFLLYQLLQNSMVWLYHDDYGYVCLKYGFDVGTVSTNYNFGELIEYLRLHYLGWGGRVLYYFLFIFTYRYGGLIGLRIVQALILTLISYEIYSVVRGKDKDSILLAFTTAAMWGMLQVTVLRESVYWFAASSGYVWPLATLLAGILVQRDIWQIRSQKLKYGLCAALFFFAAFSQEQVALLTMVYCGMVMLYEIKHIQKANAFCLAGALLGGAIEILAPGNFARASGNENPEFMAMNLLEKILRNVPRILNLNFGSHSMLFVITLLVTVVMGSSVLYKKGRVGKWIFAFGVAGISYPIMYLVRIRYGVFGMGLYYLMGVWTILVATWLVIYCIRSRNHFLTSLLVGAVAAQAMLSVLPALNYRTAIITQILSMVLILSVGKEFAEIMSWNKKRICGVGIVYLAMILCYAVNALQIGVGYYYNNRFNRANHDILSEAKEEIKAGEEVTTVTLYKMHDDRYAEGMPYVKEYMVNWVKEYYELPRTVEFVYEDAWKYVGE